MVEIVALVRAGVVGIYAYHLAYVVSNQNLMENGGKLRLLVMPLTSLLEVQVPNQGRIPYVCTQTESSK